MKVFLSAWLERLRTSYWFIPSLLSISAVILSFVTVHVDTQVKAKWVRATGWIWAGGPEGARNVLATIAGSTITVAGVVFSITIVSLTLASSQFGPRLLRNFMADRATRFVLGVFVSTFLYCLLVLRTIRGTDAATFVPFLSVTCGLILAVASVGFLIFFIHHVSTSILAENLIARVATELREGMDRLFPDSLGEDEDDAADENEPPEVAAWMKEESHRMNAPQSGFIQALDAEQLFNLASEEDLVVRLHHRPGNFVAEGSLLAEVWSKGKAGKKITTALANAFCLGVQRTPTQDVEYSIDQLAEVTVRALSPGINDPFTAITCIEWLGSALVQAGKQKMPSRYQRDEGGKLRLITEATNFSGIASACFDQIREYGCSSVAVTLRLLDVIERVGGQVRAPARSEILAEHARKIREDGIRQAENESDRSQIETRFEATSKALLLKDA
ncbi:MAG: DUF2254 domain-containing protein [Verrucomicrobiota bacterium]|nr:DUF2254 domain-containing protein [Verrucomicrobiota bacterium]